MFRVYLELMNVDNGLMGIGKNIYLRRKRTMRKTNCFLEKIEQDRDRKVEFSLRRLPTWAACHDDSKDRAIMETLKKAEAEALESKIRQQRCWESSSLGAIYKE